MVKQGWARCPLDAQVQLELDLGRIQDDEDDPFRVLSIYTQLARDHTADLGRAPRAARDRFRTGPVSIRGRH